MRSFAASGVRVACCFVVVAGSVALTGCGGSGGSEATGSATSPSVSTPSTANQAPTISGAAQTSAVAGSAYSFKPNASDADNDKVTFTIANKPAWAAFDAITGALTGTPTAGTYSNIEIAATDGKAVTVLPAFTITVTAPASTGAGSAALSWTPPTQNEDGSTLTDLSGYRIHYGTASHAYTQTVSISNPGLTQYLVDSLPTGKYFMAMTAYNAAGAESGFSDEVSVTVN